MTVSATVTGNGTARVLDYRIATRPGEQVTFLEQAHGAQRQIGTASAARGAIHFTTPLGGDSRTIEADIAINGVPVPDEQNIKVARFTAPRFVTPGRSSHVTARWHGSTLEVSWHGAANATSYAVTVSERHGLNLHFLTRALSLPLTDARPWRAGTVTVIAISSDGSRGPAVTASYAAVRKAPDQFLAFSELIAGSKSKKG
jgi:hypothetical protein